MASHLILTPLSSLNPPSSARTWQSVVHPSLPLVATASSDKTVRVYSLSSFTLLSTVSGGHKRSVRAVAWKPGTRKGEAVLATGSFDASAGIWKKHYPPGSGVEDPIGGGGGALEVDVSRSSRIPRGEDDEGYGDEGEDSEDDDYAFTVLLDGHESEIKSLAFSPSSRYLATCSRDKSVWIWEELEDDNWETVAVLQEHDGDVKCVAWHPTEELLASSSYDDTIRLYKEDVDDWMQIAVLSGHEKTVWWVEFEPEVDHPSLGSVKDSSLSQEQKDFLIQQRAAGPRLISCSDDLTIRIWQRQSAANTGGNNSGIPSIIRSHSIEEEWTQEAVFPAAHERSIYALSWSKKTGMIASAGSDGKIVVYKEVWKTSETTAPIDTVDSSAETTTSTTAPIATEWVIVASVENAHDVFEVNHVTWAKRWDRGRKDDSEEVIVSTADDGDVKVWILEEASSSSVAK